MQSIRSALATSREVRDVVRSGKFGDVVRVISRPWLYAVLKGKLPALLDLARTRVALSKETTMYASSSSCCDRFSVQTAVGAPGRGHTASSVTARPGRSTRSVDREPRPQAA